MEDQILSVLLDMQKNMKSMDARLDQLNQDVSGLKTGQESLQQDVSGLKAGQESLQLDVSGLKGDVSGLKTGQESLQQDVSGLKAGQESLQQDVSGLKAGQESLQEQVVKTNITLENEIGLKLTALFDGRQLDMEKMDHINQTVDKMSERFVSTDILARSNAAKIKSMKEKIG